MQQLSIRTFRTSQCHKQTFKANQTFNYLLSLIEIQKQLISAVSKFSQKMNKIFSFLQPFWRTFISTKNMFVQAIIFLLKKSEYENKLSYSYFATET